MLLDVRDYPFYDNTSLPPVKTCRPAFLAARPNTAMRAHTSSSDMVSCRDDVESSVDSPLICDIHRLTGLLAGTACAIDGGVL